ncbi:MAG: hypothetical protein FDZ69_00310 [Deltaproteobacteria bacterium]|nr:MAG: hypothetical protein FDZ69_00310 [Deltaproteobacteria bacterium]
MNKIVVTLSCLSVVISIASLAIIFNLHRQVESQSDAINAKIDQQSMLINRALGNVMPLVLPPDVESKISEMESRLADESRWPKDAAEVQKQQSEMTNLMNSLPPWAQEELLPRLVPRMWELDTLEILKKSTGLLENDQLMSAKAENLLTQKPPKASDVLANRLDAWQANIESQLASKEKMTTFNNANAALAGQGNIEAAAVAISAYDEPQARELSNKLNKNIVEKGLSSQVSVLAKDVLEYKNNTPEIQEYLYNKAFQIILDIKSRAALAELANEPKLNQPILEIENTIKQNLTRLMSEQQKNHAEKIRKYQIWALDQIKSLRNIDDIKNEAKETTGKMTFYGDGKLAVSQIVRDELIKYLSPINQGLLDEAVLQLFRKVYQSGFERLNEDDQFEVVKAFATATKRPLE